MMGTSAAIADDWQRSGQQPAWSQRCDRNWDNDYCNPKVNSPRDPEWDSNQDQWQNHDSDQWRRDQERWQSRDQDEWRNRDRYSRSRLASGTYIPTFPERQRRIVLRRSESYPLTLIVDQSVGETRRGQAVLPRGSRIEGELVPRRSGYRFESNQVRFPNGRSQDFWSVSDIIRSDRAFDRNDRNDANVSNGALSILAAILGRSNASNSVVLGDAYERYPNSRRDLAVIYPDRIDLRLTRDFVTDRRNF
jgi:hypothetical protein